MGQSVTCAAAHLMWSFSPESSFERAAGPPPNILKPTLRPRPLSARHISIATGSAASHSLIPRVHRRSRVTPALPRPPTRIYQNRTIFLDAAVCSTPPRPPPHADCCAFECAPHVECAPEHANPVAGKAFDWWRHVGFGGGRSSRCARVREVSHLT